MAGLETEISRLKHKDVRIRRRAVRHLFEADIDTALSGFVPLLNDDDPWFKSKAFDAHRRWAKSESDLMPLLDVNSRLAAELLENIEAPELAKVLFGNDDNVTRAFAASALCDDVELHDAMSKDIHHSIRRVAAENSEDSSIISTLMQDKHSSVRRAAIATAARNNIELSDEAIESALNSSDPSLRSLAASLAVQRGGDLLSMACSDSNPKVRSSISSAMRTELLDVDERVELVASEAPDIIIRWLRGRYDVNASTLRWSMIENTELDSRTRSKLIEQMDGRTDIDKSRLAIITEDESQLVRITANNLSASLDEIGGEGV